MTPENQTPTPSGAPDPSQPGTGLPNSPLNPPSAPAPVQPSQPVSPGEVGSVPAKPNLTDLIGPDERPPVESEPEPTALANIAGGFSSIMGAIFSWIIFPVAVVLILHNFVFQAYHVLGTSMVPTLHETDYLIISKLGYTEALIQRTFGQNAKYIPARGQIVVFRYPKDPSKVFVKRVVGVPGDRIVIKNGVVTVYNKDKPEGFDPDKGYETKDTVTLIDTDEVVQTGNIFVMGDNRVPGGSYDSREWGELPSSYIIGNAVLRLLPLDQVKVL